MSVQQVTRYVAYLSQRLAPASIPKYLNVLRILHLEAGLPDPHVHDMYHPKAVLTGFEKLRGLTPRRMSPITPSILLNLRALLDLSQVDDSNMWAATLTGFFGLLRKSNLFPPTTTGFDPGKHLSRSDFQPMPWGYIVRVRWTKTIQKKERVLEIPLLALDGHPLCPVNALRHAFRLTAGGDPCGPAFLRAVKRGLTPLLYRWYMERFRALLKRVGCEPDEYGSHSLRRGGASWALQCGIQSDVIKILGDWKSQAYQAYLEVSLEQKLSHMRRFTATIPEVHVKSPAFSS